MHLALMVGWPLTYRAAQQQKVATAKLLEISLIINEALELFIFPRQHAVHICMYGCT